MTEARVISRAEAKAAGLTRYFTGKPCPKGHVADRFTGGGGCVECARLYNRALRSANPELAREQRRAWYAANPEPYRERALAWYFANKERSSIRSRARYAANSEELKARNRAWYASNPERRRELCQNKRARKLAAEGSHTAADIARIISAQKHKCALCRKSVKKKYHVDHIEPLALGGSNWPSNLQILCPSCNCSKGAKDPIDFAREMGKLL
jgi:5-methylcytosine-specific restriction endonuclease McrA